MAKLCQNPMFDGYCTSNIIKLNRCHSQKRRVVKPVSTWPSLTLTETQLSFRRNASCVPFSASLIRSTMWGWARIWYDRYWSINILLLFLWKIHEAESRKPQKRAVVVGFICIWWTTIGWDITCSTCARDAVMFLTETERVWPSSPRCREICLDLHKHTTSYNISYYTTLKTISCWIVHRVSRLSWVIPTYITLHCIASPYSTLQYHTNNTIQYNTIPYHSITSINIYRYSIYIIYNIYIYIYIMHFTIYNNGLQCIRYNSFSTQSESKQN